MVNMQDLNFSYGKEFSLIAKSQCMYVHMGILNICYAIIRQSVANVDGFTI